MQQRLPIPLPRAKFGSPDESDEETDEDVPATTPSTRDPVDGDPEVPSSSTQSLADQIHALTAHFDAYWDELQEHRVALSQDMDSIRAEMAAIRASSAFFIPPSTTTAMILSLPFCFIFFFYH